VGYDLHITRREDWIDEGDDITAAEWLAYVERDPELQLLPEQGPYFAMWRGECEYEEPWFDWKNGQIYTKNPDKAIVNKMLAMAREFAAKVEGDDGETYERGEQIDQPRPAPPVRPTTFAERVAAWFVRFQPIQSLRFRLGMEAYRAGEKLLDPWGKEYTVTRIVRWHGNTRCLYTRRADGTEHRTMIPANGFFTRVGKRR
jgi:hypothetical protein